MIQCRVHNPLNHVVTASYGILGDGQTAVIEMSQASGIQYINDQTRNPLATTTYGTGQMMVDAAKHGVKQIIVGLGGSATNDGGAGMTQAIGVKLLDKKGHELRFGGGNLNQLAKIDASAINPSLKQLKVIIASDVTAPLTGPNGASAVFGPQKGATREMVQVLDDNLHHCAAIIKRDVGRDVESKPGAGAAGGLGAGLMAFTNYRMKSGIDIVIKFTHLKKRAKDADFVFTGEGGIDYQTKFGKAPYGTAMATKEVAPQAPVIALAGNVGAKINTLYSAKAIDAIFATPAGAKSLAKAVADGAHDIALTAENVGRLIKAVQKQ